MREREEAGFCIPSKGRAGRFTGDTVGASTTTPTFWTSAGDMSEQKGSQVRMARQSSAGTSVKRSRGRARAPLALDSGSSEGLGEERV